MDMFVPTNYVFVIISEVIYNIIM